MMICKLGPKPLHYKKAMAQQEKGGRTWRVVEQVVKRPDGKIDCNVFEDGLPHKKRAKTLAKILNHCKI